MTIDKKEVINLPKWLVILLLPILVSGIVTLTLISINKGVYTEKVDRNTIEIETLKQTKVDRNEMNYIINTLTRIEDKIDEREKNSLKK